MGQRQKSFRKEPARFGAPFISPSLTQTMVLARISALAPRDPSPSPCASSSPSSWNSASYQYRGPAWKHQALVMRNVESSTPQRSLGPDRGKSSVPPPHLGVLGPKVNLQEEQTQRQTLTYSLNTLEIKVDEESRVYLCVPGDT